MTNVAWFAFIAAILVMALAWWTVHRVKYADMHIGLVGTLLFLGQAEATVNFEVFHIDARNILVADTMSVVFVLILAIRRPVDWKWLIIGSLLAQIFAHISFGMSTQSDAELTIYGWTVSLLFVSQLATIVFICTDLLRRPTRKLRWPVVKEAAPYEAAPIPFDPYRGGR